MSSILRYLVQCEIVMGVVMTESIRRGDALITVIVLKTIPVSVFVYLTCSIEVGLVT